MGKGKATTPAGQGATPARRTRARTKKTTRQRAGAGSKRGAPKASPAEIEARWAIIEPILAYMAAGGTLNAYCREKREQDATHPAASTVRLWVVNDEPKGFADRYARAREAQAHAWADQIVEISDDATGDTYLDEKDRPRTDYENINRSRLRVDSRRWLMGKLCPREYGEKLDVTSKGQALRAPVVKVLRGPEVAA